MQSPDPGLNTIYVAVVDDDESLCRSLSRLLRVAGYQSVTYRSAEALLGDTKRPRYDCLVLDVQLEGMSGLELKRRLEAVKDQTPVVFITAHDAPEIRSQANAIGCAGFFLKSEPGERVLKAISLAVGVPCQPSAPASPATSLEAQAIGLVTNPTTHTHL